MSSVDVLTAPHPLPVFRAVPSSTNERMAALPGAVPTRRRPGTASGACVT